MTIARHSIFLEIHGGLPFIILSRISLERLTGKEMDYQRSRCFADGPLVVGSLGFVAWFCLKTVLIFEAGAVILARGFVIRQA